MKKVTLIAILLFTFYQGCRNSDNPVQSQAFVNSPTSVSALKDSILYRLSITADSISSQDTLRGSFLLINQSKTQRVIHSPDSPIFQWVLRDSSGNNAMGMYGPNHHLVYMDTLNPNDTLRFAIQEKVPNLSKGLYTLDADLYYPDPPDPVLSLKIVMQ